MNDFRHRSSEKELLDRDDIPFDDIRRNMEELNLINSRLGGHDITVSGIRKLSKGHARRTLQILEIGCGGGDNLRAIQRWAREQNLPLQLSGVDINPECIRFARSLDINTGIDFYCSDYRELQTEHEPDIIFSSLFCHHFTDDELVHMLQWMQRHSRIGFFINDLHRHPLAYYSIKWITALFSKSYLVKNDAPISVKRGFLKQEWIALFKKAELENYCCHWKWAFRWLIIYPCR